MAVAIPVEGLLHPLVVNIGHYSTVMSSSFNHLLLKPLNFEGVKFFAVDKSE